MRILSFMILVSSYFLMASLSFGADMNNINEERPNTVVLTVQEQKHTAGDLSITYSDYGHEHASSGPDEPFEATVGFYSFLISDGASSESFTVYRGVDETGGEPIMWQDHTIRLLHVSDDQREVTLQITSERK